MAGWQEAVLPTVSLPFWARRANRIRRASSRVPTQNKLSFAFEDRSPLW
jgi:hypothetical protein